MWPMRSKHLPVIIVVAAMLLFGGATMAEPDPTTPDPGVPGTTEPGTTDPGDPEPTDPDPGNPDPGNPDPGDPDPTDPDPDNPPDNPVETAFELKPTDEKATLRNKVWIVPVNAKKPTVTLKRTSLEGAASYQLVVTGKKDAVLFNQPMENEEITLELTSAEVNSTLAIQLIALNEAGEPMKTVTIQLMPFSQSGFRPSRWGSWGRGGMGGPVGITPGKALTTSHANGSKNMTSYNKVSILPGEEAMSILTLNGTKLPLTLDGGASKFTVKAASGAITLTPVKNGSSWQVNGHVLTMVRKSGVKRLLLQLGDTTLTLATEWEPQGTVYASLRALGYVSSDFDWQLTADGITATVDGKTYRVENDRLMAEGE